MPDTAARVVCLPHAGGVASFYYPMSELLASSSVEVLAVQYPGRHDRRDEAALETIDELADGVLTALEPWHDKPLILFGHSMGAIIAFEVARRLDRDVVGAPHALVVSGRRAPSCERAARPHLNDDELVAEVCALGGTDLRLLGSDDLLRMALPVIRTDYQAIERYRGPGNVRVGCPLTVLTGDRDPMTTIEEARAWEKHASGPFDVLVFSGGHFFLTEHERAVAAVLRDHVAQRDVR